MSAYRWAVQIGMPEGLADDQQQVWLHKWRDSLLGQIERLTTLVRLTRRQLWRAEVDNNPFADDDAVPFAWNELTERLLREREKP